MTYNFNLQDIMGNFTGGPAVPDDMPDYGAVSTATTQAITTPEIKTNLIPEQSTTYDRMLQAESGNRDYDAQGRPMTSPAGAMFASQVMPATAAAPGYGVRPAQAQTPEEYNRVGREYFQALVNKFGGDEQKAAAAYNAGPGRIQQNINQNNGQMNVAQLPRETQGYLQKIGQAVGNMIPSAQASTLPPQPNLPVMKPAVPPQAAPQPAPSNFQGQTDEFGGVDQAIARQAQQPFTGQGLSFGGKTQQQLQQELVQQQQEKQNNEIINSNNQQDIAKLAFGVDTPKNVQNAALDKLHDTMAYNESMRRAQRKMDELGTNANARELNKAMNDKETGSYFKVLLFQALGWTGKAQEQLDMLMPSVKYSGTTLGNGESYSVKYNKDTNEVMAAWDAQGKPVTDSATLGSIAASGMGKKLDIVGGTYVNDVTGEVGRVVTDQTTGRSFVQTDKGMKPMTGFRPQSSTGTLEDMRTRALQELQIKLVGKSKEEAMAIARPYNQMLLQAGKPIIQPDELPITVPQVERKPAGAPATAQPQQGAVAPQAAAPQQAAPVQGPVAPGPAQGAGLGGRPTGPELEAAKTKAKEEAEKVGADLGTIRANQPKAEEAADYLITKVDELVTHPGFKFSVGIADAGGVPLPGAGTIAGLIPGTDTSDWSARFKEVQGRQFLQAVETLRGTGAISNQEGESAKAAIARMSTSQSEKEFKEAIKDFKGIVQRGVDNNRIKLGQEPKYGTLPASETAATPMSPADKARAEIEKRKKEKKG
jgi:soluble lytic murein transglycosylase